MFHVELTNEENEVLGQVLERALAGLEVEILHTDHSEFKEHLRERREVLQALQLKFAAPAEVAG